MATAPVVQATLEVDKCPTDKFSLQNCAVINPGEPIVAHAEKEPTKKACVKYTRATREGRKDYYLTVLTSTDIQMGRIGLSGVQREWLGVEIKRSRIAVEREMINKATHLVGKLSLEIEFYTTQKKAQPAINTDELSDRFCSKFDGNVFCVGQVMVLGFEKVPLLKAKVLQIQTVDASQLLGKRAPAGPSKKKVSYGLFYPESRVVFEKHPDSAIQLVGRHKGDSAHTSIISPDWDFKKMEIGGLDKEFSDIFRRAFASRVFPPEVIEQLGMKHVRGILLYGPPGTGKTLMARQIGKMLHAREPKIINGPEVLNKYVGESELNIRNLFAEAEKEQKDMGINSALHIIIFDELDAICRTRGSLTGSTGVHDTVVNQLLAKIDGVEQLNNILLIGMTNRLDMIDEALLRPGRLEVKMEIGLPDEDGRVEILQIHTAKMTHHKKLSPDVNLEELAKKTRNFSGAEIEGLVRSAQSTAMNRMIQAKDQIVVSHEEADRLKVTAVDFEHALLYDVKPAFGISDETLDNYVLNGIITWGAQVMEILQTGQAMIKQTLQSVRTPLVSMLLRGEVGCGKTALAAHIARESHFPFVKVITPENMIGFTEGAKCQAIKKVFDDAYKSEVSCIVIDDIERLLDYVAIGPRFSNTVLQAILVLLRRVPPISSGKGQHKLLIIATTGFSDEVLERTGLRGAFNDCIDVPYLRTVGELMFVLRGDSEDKEESTRLYSFTAKQLRELELKLKGFSVCIGIKKLLAAVEISLLTADPIGSLVRKVQEESRASQAVKRMKLDGAL